MGGGWWVVQHGMQQHSVYVCTSSNKLQEYLRWTREGVQREYTSTECSLAAWRRYHLCYPVCSFHLHQRFQVMGGLEEVLEYLTLSSTPLPPPPPTTQLPHRVTASLRHRRQEQPLITGEYSPGITRMPLPEDHRQRITTTAVLVV